MRRAVASSGASAAGGRPTPGGVPRSSSPPAGSPAAGCRQRPACQPSRRQAAGFMIHQLYRQCPGVACLADLVLDSWRDAGFHWWCWSDPQRNSISRQIFNHGLQWEYFAFLCVLLRMAGGGRNMFACPLGYRVRVPYLNGKCARESLRRRQHRWPRASISPMTARLPAFRRSSVMDEPVCRTIVVSP